MRDIAHGGITVTEAVGADQPIVRLPTATTGFVGRALRGPVNRPVRVRNFAEYQQVFGGLWQPSMLSYAVEQYFENGGREAVIVRVVNGGAPATISLPCGQEQLTLEALSPGSREVLRASVDYDNIAPSEDDRFNLVVQRVRSLGSEHIEDQEIFRRLSIEPGTTRFVVAALQESLLVRVRGAVPRVRPDRTFRAGARHPIGYVDSNPDGDDGSPLTDYDLIGSAERGTGLFALRDVDDLHFLCVPPPARDRDVGPGVLLVAAQFCRDHRALLVVDPPAAWQTSDDALQGPARTRLPERFTRFCAFRACRRSTGCAAATSRSPTAARSPARSRAWIRTGRRGTACPTSRSCCDRARDPLRLLTDADCQRLAAQGINPLHCGAGQRGERRAAQDAGAWHGGRSREFAAHVPPAAVAHDQQHRERHALGALRRARPQHLAAPRRARCVPSCSGWRRAARSARAPTCSTAKSSATSASTRRTTSGMASCIA